MAALPYSAHNMTREGRVYGGVISGIVQDENGGPARHHVVAIHKDSRVISGGAISDSVTGEYAIATNVVCGKDLHSVVDMHPNGGQNDRVFGHVTPL